MRPRIVQVELADLPRVAEVLNSTARLAGILAKYAGELPAEVVTELAVLRRALAAVGGPADDDEASNPAAEGTSHDQ